MSAFVQRLLSRSQPVYLRMEARGLRALRLAARRQVARAVEEDPGIDGILISEGGVILIRCKSARKDVEVRLRRLAEAGRMVPSRLAQAGEHHSPGPFAHPASSERIVYTNGHFLRPAISCYYPPIPPEGSQSDPD
jgi:hypothetical protein